MGLSEELAQRVRILERRTAFEWQTDLRRTSPVDTGNMQSKTTVRDTPGRLTATVDTDYAVYVSEGTQPHVIRARNVSALSFVWRGKRVFFKSVNHPGTTANPWFTDSVRRLPATMQRIWASLR